MGDQLTHQREAMYEAFCRYRSVREQAGEWGKLYCEAIFGRISGCDDLYAYTEYINLDYGWISQPAWSAFVPIAHLNEPVELTTSIIDKIAECAKNGAGMAEVNLWANTYSDDPQLAQSMAAFDSYTTGLKKWALARSRQRHGFTADLVRIRAACMNNPDLDFNHIRAEGTGSIAIDGLRRHFTADHPIVWLDGDTPFLDRQAIPKMLTALRDQRAHFVRGQLILTSDHGRIPPYHRPTEEEKIASLYGLARQIIEETLGFTDPRGYVDESSLAFTILTYFLSGGVSVKDPRIGESRSLLARGEQAQADNVLDPTIPLLGFVSDAHVGNSDRRFVALARSLKPVQLPDSVAGDNYVEYTRLDPATIPPRQDPVTESEVRQMVEYMLRQQRKRTPNLRPRPDRMAYLYAAIGQCGFVTD